MRDQFTSALQAIVNPAKAESEQIAQAMWNNVVPAGVVQVPRWYEPHPVTAVLDEAGQPLTQEGRAKNKVSRPYDPRDATRNFREEHQDRQDLQENLGAADRFVPQVPRVCRNQEAQKVEFEYDDRGRLVGRRVVDLNAASQGILIPLGPNGERLPPPPPRPTPDSLLNPFRYAP